MTGPRRNRVDPFGHIHAVADHGDLMGNRGCLHDDEGRLLREHGSYKGWVSCVTRWGDRKQVLMAPGRYTQLFFRDEATAMAAGHRPCHDCRRDRAKAFHAAWATAHGGPGRVTDIDRLLHSERMGARAAYDGRSLPDGCMIGLADESAAWLAWRGQFRRWNFAGYGGVEHPEGNLVLLTPLSVVAAIRAGYSPEIHASVTALP